MRRRLRLDRREKKVVRKHFRKLNQNLSDMKRMADLGKCQDGGNCATGHGSVGVRMEGECSCRRRGCGRGILERMRMRMWG